MISTRQTRRTKVKAKDLPARGRRDVTGGLLTTLIANLKQVFDKPPTRGGGCEDFGCGTTNHNETLLRD
jgi:hypothetical protein